MKKRGEKKGKSRTQIEALFQDCTHTDNNIHSFIYNNIEGGERILQTMYDRSKF